MILNKVPPQNVEIEQAVIGSMMSSYNAIIDIVDIIRPEHFYNNAHQIICDVVFSMFHNGVKEIDILTVTQEIKAREKLDDVGGAYYISSLLRVIGSTHNVAYHAHIIRSLYLKRKIIELIAEGTESAFNDELNGDEIISNLSANLVALDYSSSSMHISDAVRENNELVEKIRSGETDKVGISSGISDIDNIINGLQSPDLIIAAGRPGMGKTAFAISILANVAIEQRMPVAMFSLEMSASQIDFRLESMYSGVEYGRLQHGRITHSEMELYRDAQQKISSSPVYVIDDPDVTPETLRAKVLRLKMQYDIKLVIVDYIQLMESSGRNFSRENEVSKITRSLKKIAKEADVPMIALSQLNREVEKRNPPEPRLSDLRESGSIEQDADIIMLLYRPEYYDIKSIEKDGVTISTENMCVVDISKHRNGKVGKVPVSFYGNVMKFTNYGEAKEAISDLPF